MATYTPPETFEVIVRLYTIAEVCQLMKISRSSLYKLFSDEKLVARKIGGSTRVRSDDLAAFLDRLPHNLIQTCDAEGAATLGCNAARTKDGAK